MREVTLIFQNLKRNSLRISRIKRTFCKNPYEFTDSVPDASSQSVNQDEKPKKYVKNQFPASTKLIQSSPDLTTLLHPGSKNKIVSNLVDRLSVTNETEAITKLQNLYDLKNKTITYPSQENREALNKAALQFPNFSHPIIMDLKEPKLLFDNTNKFQLEEGKKIRSFDEISTKVFKSARTKETGQTTSEKSYYLFGPLAELEQALIRYTIDYLTKRCGFTLVSVPDILNPQIIEACGMSTTGKITNVFKLNSKFYGDKALSGTAEMAFGALFRNKKIDFTKQKVQKYAAVSRCYRAESAMGRKERGLYRVHQFTKVEMFVLTPCDIAISDMVHEQILSIQQRLFDDLELIYRVLDMHPGDLGAPAARKFDCEALMPGFLLDKEPFYGEISSTSNCTDYQSRRLNIRDISKGSFCHTLNGTACAIPRMIMTICEQFQMPNGCINLPKKLWPYMPSMKYSIDNFLGPRPKSKKPDFVYNKNPNNFAKE